MMASARTARLLGCNLLTFGRNSAHSFSLHPPRIITSRLLHWDRRARARAAESPASRPQEYCCRYFTTATGSEDEARITNEHHHGATSPKDGSGNSVIKVKSWPLQLPSPFGKLLIEETSFPVRVIPTNPHDYPAGDRVFIHLLAAGPHPEAPRESEHHQELDSIIESLAVDCSLFKQGVLLSHKNLDQAGIINKLSLAWLIEVPTCYDVQVTSSSLGHVSVENLENEHCSILTESGDIRLKSMKSGLVNVQSSSGSISCVKVLQGSGILETRQDGMVTADRLQGLDFDISTETGSIHIKDIYARAVQVRSSAAPITINNMHTECEVTTCADVDVGCMEGTLTTVVSGSGSFSGYLSRHDEVNIQTEQGDIVLKVPEECRSCVDLQGKEVTLDKALMFQSNKAIDSENVTGELNGGGTAVIKARTQHGSITVKTQSWFDSLSLNRR